MFVYIKTKNLIKGVNEFSFNIDTKREECLYIEDGNIVLIRDTEEFYSVVPWKISNI